MSNTKKTGKYEEKLTPLQKVLSGIGLVLCVVFGFLLICNLTIIIKGAIHPEEPPSVLGITPMVVLSGSMSGEAEDHIEVGDLIFIDKIQPEELKEGDIIAFMEGQVIITHRIVEIRNEDGLQFITQGDANNTVDRNPVTQDNLVGIYKSRIPKVGDFAIFLQTPLGMILFIGIPLLAFIVYDVIRRQRFMAREQARREELMARLKNLSEEKTGEPV